MSIYLPDYGAALGARCAQTLPSRGDSRTVYDARHPVRCAMPVGRCIKQWANLGGRGAVLKQSNTHWLELAFFRYTEGCSYNVRVVNRVAQYLDVFFK